MTHRNSAPIMMVESHMAAYPPNFHYAAGWSDLSIRDPELVTGTTLSDLAKGFGGIIGPAVTINRSNNML